VAYDRCGCGQLRPVLAWLRLAVVRLSLAMLRRDLAVVRRDLAVVQPDLARCGQPCTFALVQPSEVHLFIFIPISVYLQVKIPTKLVEPH
jgi:hypothetical protein